MVTKGKPMKKLTIASMLLASVGATVVAAPAFAADAPTPAQTAIAAAQATGLTLEQAVEEAIKNNPDLASDIIAAAISVVGAESAQVAGILTAATNAGVDSDTVTAIAVANSVDATVASQATAAGNNDNGNNGNNANDNGNQSNSDNSNSNAGSGNNNAGGNNGGNSGGGGGGGGGGISENGL
jgi:uncharacterized membrane protein YgcG